MAPIRYNNRVAIVTGAGAGLGRQYAIMLASRGAKILVNDMDRASGAATVVLIEAAGGEAALQVGSVTEGAAVVEAAVSRWGRIDIVVSNAGVLRDVSFHKMTDAAFETVLSVHLRGSYAVVRAAWPHMRAAGYGRVVLITSVNGLYGQFGQANYSAAKLGLVGLAKTLAIEGASKNIKVNALAPGAGTAMTATVMPAEIVAKWKPEYAARLGEADWARRDTAPGASRTPFLSRGQVRGALPGVPLLGGAARERRGLRVGRRLDGGSALAALAGLLLRPLEALWPRGGARRVAPRGRLQRRWRTRGGRHARASLAAAAAGDARADAVEVIVLGSVQVVSTGTC